jgi:translation initiation factor IF-3
VDLVEIAATANPPVCRLMDYGKFKYQEQKKGRGSEAKQTVIEIKEIKFRPGRMTATTTSSCATSGVSWRKATSARSRCASAGREITHQEIGMALLNRLRDDLGDTILVEQFPKLEGRQMIMMIAPGKKKPAPAKPATEVAPAPAGATTAQ